MSTAKLSYKLAEKDKQELGDPPDNTPRLAARTFANCCVTAQSGASPETVWYNCLGGEWIVTIMRLIPSMRDDPDMQNPPLESAYRAPIIAGTLDDLRSPDLASSPLIKTPPLVTGKRNHLNGSLAHAKERADSEPIDPGALSKVLKEFEEAGNMRERTPGGSPSRKRQRIYGDRSVDFLEIMLNPGGYRIRGRNGGSGTSCTIRNYGGGLCQKFAGIGTVCYRLQNLKRKN